MPLGGLFRYVTVKLTSRNAVAGKVFLRHVFTSCLILPRVFTSCFYLFQFYFYLCSCFNGTSCFLSRVFTHLHHHIEQSSLLNEVLASIGVQLIL